MSDSILNGTLGIDSFFVGLGTSLAVVDVSRGNGVLKGLNDRATIFPI